MDLQPKPRTPERDKLLQQQKEDAQKILDGIPSTRGRPKKQTTTLKRKQSDLIKDADDGFLAGERKEAKRKSNLELAQSAINRGGHQVKVRVPPGRMPKGPQPQLDDSEDEDDLLDVERKLASEHNPPVPPAQQHFYNSILEGLRKGRQSESFWFVPPNLTMKGAKITKDTNPGAFVHTEWVYMGMPQWVRGTPLHPPCPTHGFKSKVSKQVRTPPTMSPC
jgi:hypothetical protein